ncbi:MAG TPA: amidohydrolase [Candidatus Fimivivens faecavium]|nr:amidohydrolase [Candidatus Fimivivens faecavium]
MDRTEQRILQAIDQNSDKIIGFAKDLYRHPELSFCEVGTAKKAAGWLRGLALPVEEGLAVNGVRARLGEGGPNVCIIGELDGILCREHPDADPVTGASHACGHHCQLTALAGAALALSDPQVRAELGGTVTFFAVPAEEYVDEAFKLKLQREGKIRFNSGKSELLRIGAFDGIDMALACHVHMVDCESDLLIGNNSSNGWVGRTITIRGKAAHAAAAPHEGVNALSAASLGLSALGFVRETFREKDYVRVHPIMTRGGDAVNVIPDEVVLEMMVRAKTIGAIRDAAAKTDRAFRGAAAALGATAEIRGGQGDMPILYGPPEPAMVEAAALLGGVSVELTDGSVHTVASTDLGDLSHRMPILNFTHGGVTGALHSADFRVVDEEKAYLMPARLMALTVCRLLRGGAKRANEIKAAFRPAFATAEEYVRAVEELSR